METTKPAKHRHFFKIYGFTSKLKENDYSKKMQKS